VDKIATIGSTINKATVSKIRRDPSAIAIIEEVKTPIVMA